MFSFKNRNFQGITTLLLIINLVTAINLCATNPFQPVPPPLTGGKISITMTEIESGTSPGVLLNKETPANCTGIPVFTWQYSTDGTNWIDISNSNFINYSVPVISQTTWFRRKVTAGSDAYSNEIQISVNDPLDGGKIYYGNIRVADGSQKKLFKVQTKGNKRSGKYEYQWEQSTDGTNFQAIPNALDSTLLETAVANNSWLRRQVKIKDKTNVSNTIIYAAPASFISGGTISVTPTTIDYGGSFTINNITNPSGSGCLTFLLENYYSPDNGLNWIPLAGATTVPGTSLIKRVASCGAGSAESNIVTVTVNLSPGSISASSYAISSNTSVTLNSISAACGGYGTLSYQWQQSATNAENSYQDISGQTALTCTLSPSASMYYRRKVKDGNNQIRTSNIVYVEVSTLLPGSISIATSTVNYNQSPGTITSTTPATGYSGAITYSWQKSEYISATGTFSNYSDIANSDLTYTVPNLTVTTKFHRGATDQNYTTVYTEPVTIIVGAQPAGVTSVNGQTGDVALGLTNTATGTSRILNLTNAAGGTTFNVGGVDKVNQLTGTVNLALSTSLSGNTRTIGLTGGSSVTFPNGGVNTVNGQSGTVVLGLTTSLSGTTRTIGISNGNSISFDIGNQNQHWAVSPAVSGGIYYKAANNRVGIGTTQPDAELSVVGKIHAKEVLIDNNVTVPDYVFGKNYRLMDLKTLENFIKTNNHLPEVPSASEFDTKGINLSVMNMLLLKKVEELTLYIIELHKQVGIMKGEFNSIQYK